jgi:hypothetical protein
VCLGNSSYILSTLPQIKCEYEEIQIKELKITSASQMQSSLKLGGRITSAVDWLRTSRRSDIPRMSNAEDSLRASRLGGLPGVEAAVGEI